MIQPRIIVCGNRNWTCKRTITRWLIHACQLARGVTSGPYMGDTPILVHGACGERDDNGSAIRGADALAHDIAVGWGWDPHPFLARWDLYGNAAGPVRNEDMAKAGAHIGLAFGELYRKGRRTGTGDMVTRLAAHGIPYIHVSRPLP